MRSTNEERISACMRAAYGREEVVTLATLNRRVAQVYAGRTKIDRRIRRTLVEVSEKMERLRAQSAHSLAAMQAESLARSQE